MNQLWNQQGQTLILTVLIVSSLIVFCSRPFPDHFRWLTNGSHTEEWSELDRPSVNSLVVFRQINSDQVLQDPQDEAMEGQPLPIAEELVANWDQPDLMLFYTGSQQGYIEPCGCTGLENQLGGILRRHSALKEFERRGWPTIKLDTGDQVKRFGQQPLVKLRRTLEALVDVMAYDSLGLGPKDLKIPSIDLAQTMMNITNDRTRFVCANVEVIDPELCQTYQVIEKNGRRLGVTMVLGEEYFEDLSETDGILVQPVASALQAVLPQMRNEKCDAMILVVAASTENCRKLARQFPEFDVLITTDCGGEPTLEPELIETSRGTMPMVQVGIKGMYIGLVGFYFDQEQPRIRYERVPLDARFDDSEEVKTVFINYQNDLKRLWLSGNFADIKPRPHPSGNQFVGSEACADCHGREYEIWEDGNSGDGGPHKHATASLTDPNERSWVQRHFDPECVSCHMTGWNPQGFFPYESGYLDHARDTHLYDNGCENCHGPGSAHVEAEKNSKNDRELLNKFRLQVRVSLEEARQRACMECHDLDNSPDFLKDGGFDNYWPEIEH